MNKGLFRKKNMDRISSPEQLNAYIRVSNPGVWMILISVILLLTGVCVWGIFGHVDTKIVTSGYVENGTLTCYVKESDIDSVKEGMNISISEQDYVVGEISQKPVAVDDTMDSYMVHIGNLQTGEWVYPVTVKNVNLKDGIYEADIIVDRVSPMSFITN
ncbi:MAG: hypothetical protein ACI4D1_03415 [Lachnospira sp.]